MKNPTKSKRAGDPAAKRREVFMASIWGKCGVEFNLLVGPHPVQEVVVGDGFEPSKA